MTITVCARRRGKVASGNGGVKRLQASGQVGGDGGGTQLLAYWPSLARTVLLAARGQRLASKGRICNGNVLCG